MKNFIKRIKDDFEYYELYEREPLFFKAFLWFVMFFVFTVDFITVPLWIILYAIYWCCKNKKGGGDNA